MALGSNRDKQPTRVAEILLNAQALDDRRQVQINRQIRIINRLVEENTALRNGLESIRNDEDQEMTAVEAAVATLAGANNITERWHREDAEWEKEQEKK
jgi:hypothetical protein